MLAFTTFSVVLLTICLFSIGLKQKYSYKGKVNIEPYQLHTSMTYIQMISTYVFFFYYSGKMLCSLMSRAPKHPFILCSLPKTNAWNSDRQSHARCRPYDHAPQIFLYLVEMLKAFRFSEMFSPHVTPGDVLRNVREHAKN